MEPTGPLSCEWLTSGEVVANWFDDCLRIGLGSDHTDRKAEAISVSPSKTDAHIKSSRSYIMQAI
jgi:hypothetical protein